MMNYSYDIIKTIGAINERTDAEGITWIKELNIMSWNGQQPLYDLREWTADRKIMRKGMRLNRDELKALQQLLNNEEL